jgi:hypothetical protein
VRHEATGFLHESFEASPSIISLVEGPQHANQPSDGPPRIDAHLGERGPADQSQLSRSAQSSETRVGRSPERMLFESQMRYTSPERVFSCDGWCEYSDVPRPNIVSIGRRS